MMRLLERDFGTITRTFTSGVALLCLCACGPAVNEQEGHKEPILGLYNVVVSGPENLTFAADASQPAPSIEVDLRVECVSVSGGELPPGCGDPPNWKVQKPVGTPFLNVIIADPSQTKTTATITVDTALYLKQYGDDINSIGSHWFMVGFVPTFVPEKMKLSGSRDITLHIDPPGLNPLRKEQPPDRPRIVANPRRVYCIIRGVKDPSIVETASIIYTGPATQLTEAFLTGAGATKFKVIAPSIPLEFKEGTDGTRLQVQFEVEDVDLNRYEATLTLSTANGAVANLLLSGQRQNF